MDTATQEHRTVRRASNSKMKHSKTNQNKIDASERLIVALDVSNFDKVKTLVKELDGTVSLFKFGLWVLAMPGIVDFATELAKQRKKIFWDVKGNDIPETLKGAISNYVENQFSFVTIHGNGDVSDAAIKAAVDAKGDSDLKILLVTVLTSLNDEDSQSIYGKSVIQLIDERVTRAIHLNCDGVICSGQEAERIREIANNHGNKDFLIVTPGIRPQNTSVDDQKRATTPYEAIRNGADYLVVGRPIIHADDGNSVAKTMIEEMQRAFDER